LTTIATITSDNGASGTTGIVYIPFPYWELWYTVNPYGEVIPPSQQITPIQGAEISVSSSGVSGSYSTVNPQFTIQVMDGNDPNRIVRTISPPGGINLDLWTGVVPTTQATPATYISKYQVQTAVTPIPAVDPRPWVEKFYEGQRNYYFIITAQSLESYSMQIRVPTRYIGKY
jgi:hypothetical protein